jgi:hypothetical protein
MCAFALLFDILGMRQVAVHSAQNGQLVTPSFARSDPRKTQDAQTFIV